MPPLNTVAILLAATFQADITETKWRPSSPEQLVFIKEALKNDVIAVRRYASWPHKIYKYRTLTYCEKRCAFIEAASARVALQTTRNTLLASITPCVTRY